MHLTEIVRIVVAALATGIWIWAAVSDVKSRRIPNLAVLILLALSVPWIVAGGAAWLSALEAAGIGFALTVLLYMLKIMGAGDSKLFAACALFAGMAYLPYLALATSLVGGVIAIISLASRPQRALVMLTLRGKGDYGRGVPYGVAISAGAILVTWTVLAGVLQPFAYFGPQAQTTQAIAKALHDH